jgi:hypothetical protein
VIVKIAANWTTKGKRMMGSFSKNNQSLPETYCACKETPGKKHVRGQGL